MRNVCSRSRVLCFVLLVRNETRSNFGHAKRSAEIDRLGKTRDQLPKKIRIIISSWCIIMILNINWIKLYILLVILVFKENSVNLTFFFEPSCKFTNLHHSHCLTKSMIKITVRRSQVRSIANTLNSF